MPNQTRCLNVECIQQRNESNRATLQNSEVAKVERIKGQIEAISTSIDQSGVELPEQRFVVPNGDEKVGKVAATSDLRRNKFGQYLRNQIEAAEATYSQPGVGAAAESNKTQDKFVDFHDSVAEHACGLCRGYCCASGGAHAFIDESVLLRVKGLNTDWSFKEIEKFYLEQLPEESAESGCVFQSGSGCQLPRTFRSDVCNHFACDELSFIAERHESVKPMVLVSIDGGGEPVRFKTIPATSENE